MSQPAYGREWLSLANLDDTDQHFVQWFVLRYRDYSPDAKRVVREWAEKFDLGVMEHGPLRLDKIDAVGDLRAELEDATSYLAMIRLQVGDIEAKMSEITAHRGGGDNTALVSRLRAYRCKESASQESLDPNDLRG